MSLRNFDCTGRVCGLRNGILERGDISLAIKQSSGRLGEETTEVRQCVQYEGATSVDFMLFVNAIFTNSGTQTLAAYVSAFKPSAWTQSLY